jgi:hypothetical protein
MPDELRELDARVAAARTRPERLPLASLEEPSHVAGKVPARFLIAPWQKPSPQRGEWFDPSPNGSHLPALASYTDNQARIGAANLAALAKALRMHVDLAGAVVEVLETADSAKQYPHTRWAGEVVLGGKPVGLITLALRGLRSADEPPSFNTRTLGDGMGTTLSYSGSGVLSARRSDRDGRSYSVAIEPLDASGELLHDREVTARPQDVAKVRITRERTLPVRGGRTARISYVTEEQILPDGGHHVRQTRIQRVWLQPSSAGESAPSTATDVLRDEVLPAR